MPYGANNIQKRKHKMSNQESTRRHGFVVMGVRHFINGCHEWLAPCDIQEAMAFGEQGEVTELEEYMKPVFESMTDAEHYAMSLAHGEYTLAIWERIRPTWYVVDFDTYLAIVERDEYSLPEEAERWSDEKVADFEREMDCEDIEYLAYWDSENDEDRIAEGGVKTAWAIDDMKGMRAWITREGYVSVEGKGLTANGVREFVEEKMRDGTLGWCKAIELVRSEGDTATFFVK